MLEDAKQNIGDQNTFGSNTRLSGSGIGDVKTHTMQDDLNALSGNTPVLKVVEKSNPSSFNNIFKTDNKINPINSGQKIAENQVKKAQSGVIVQKNIAINNPDVSEIEKPIAEKKPVMVNPQSPILSKEKSSKNPIIIAALVLVLLIFAAGGYYFWMTRQDAADNGGSSAIVETTTTTEALPVIIEPQPKKFSADKPNYLRINTVDLDAEKVAALFADTADELKQSNISQPVEFLAVDENNNPVKFAVFSLFAGIKMPKIVSDNLDDFSLYFYSDNGSVRIGAAIKIKDGKDIAKMISQEENNLVADLGPLQFEKLTVPKGKVFSSSTYRDIAIRYINLNEQITTSVDYAFMDKQWIIGTSKNTMRAILDKIIQDKENAANIQPANPAGESTKTTSTTIISAGSEDNADGAE